MAGAREVTPAEAPELHRLVAELAGVIAHEPGHIKNCDALISAVVATIAGAITLIANMAQWALIFGGLGGGDDEEDGGVAGMVGELFMILLAPIAATLIQLAISRACEFGADAAGARIAGDSIALASAMGKLETGSVRRAMAVDPATAHMYIVNPLHGGAIAGLFRTHRPSSGSRAWSNWRWGDGQRCNVHWEEERTIRGHCWGAATQLPPDRVER